MRAHLLLHPSIVFTRSSRAPARLRSQRSCHFHLLHHLFTDDPVSSVSSARQLASIKGKDYPNVDKVSLRLLKEQSYDAITMTLTEALQRLKPCSYLTQVETATETKPGVYRIRQFRDPGKQVPRKEKENPRYYKGPGRGKEVHLMTDCTSYLSHWSLKAYKFLLEGSRMEIQLHQRSIDSKESVDWALEHLPHLRPDAILAAMPEGTTMLAEPATTDLSYKQKPLSNADVTKTTVMWAMENYEALKRAKVNTRKSIKRIG